MGPKYFGATKQPTDGREVNCVATAWNFYNGADVRVSQCTGVDKENFRIAVIEMGHVYNYLLYKDQPHVYRGPASPGFHQVYNEYFELEFLISFAK